MKLAGATTVGQNASENRALLFEVLRAALDQSRTDRRRDVVERLGVVLHRMHRWGKRWTLRMPMH